MRDTLAERDGWLYIRAEYENTSEPVKYVAWYALDIRAADYRRNYENYWNGEPTGETRIGKPARHFNDGLYEIEGLKFQLPGGGRAQAKHFETLPISCPKVRKGIETRYYRGAWQKYLKSEGWVYA